MTASFQKNFPSIICHYNDCLLPIIVLKIDVTSFFFQLVSQLVVGYSDFIIEFAANFESFMPFRPLNPLGSRSEIQLTITWIRTHLEMNSEVSLPKREVYNEYM